MAEGPIHVLNALWFKPGGRAMYEDYLRRTRPLIETRGGTIERVSETDPEGVLQGDFNPDLVFFVTWPSIDELMETAGSAEYQEVAHLRTEAITKAVLTRTKAVEI